MKILVAFAVIMLVAAQVFAAEIGLSDDPDWYSDQIQEDLPVFENFLQRIARKPSPDRFYGLMGKRNNGFGHKRSSERNTIHNYERRRK
ncbi:tachykinin-like peptide isoform X2 [Hyperolius riggenbachi]|uniref:tachykinin-like peptide isoform X2 n=1 Tax=Hyperolius riggenbachi TaxID=752182 RepID=UPI0035A3A4B8